MDLTSFFRRKAPADRKPLADDGDAAQAARTRARRRLIGAVVLLAIGVIAFPLLFETEPRPIPVDLPIEIPRKDAVPPLAMPAPAAPAEATGSRAAGGVVETPVEAAPPPAAAPPAPVAEAPTPAPPPGPAPAPAPAPQPAAGGDNGTRAKALLEGRPVAAAPAAAPAPAVRYVVQIGAFAEERAVRDARAKAERAGLRTYTQVVKVAAGERTRVRVGPFDKREDADAAVAQLKKAGLPGSVLTL